MMMIPILLILISVLIMMVMLGMTLVCFWDHFGISLGPPWDHFWTILVSLWDDFGMFLEPFWDDFGMFVNGGTENYRDVWIACDREPKLLPDYWIGSTVYVLSRDSTTPNTTFYTMD